MTRLRTSKKTTIDRDPFATLIPNAEALSPQEQPVQPSAITKRHKLTVNVDGDLVNRIKNAAYWNPRLTIAKIAEIGIRYAIEQVEHENGGRYKQRESELVGGHPIK